VAVMSMENIIEAMPTNAWKEIRERWLAQVSRDPNTRDFVFKVAYFLASRVDKKTHEIWPENTKIARRFGMRTAAVQIALDRLVSGGHLELLHYSHSAMQPRCKIYRPIVLRNGSAG
jgi:hypothetical protein